MNEFGSGYSDVAPETVDRHKLDEKREIVKEQLKVVKAPEIQEFELNGQKVEFVGVEHTTPNFEKYKDIYSQKIREAELILMEAMPRQNGYQKEVMLAEAHKKGISDADFKILIEDCGIKFYDEMSRLAYENRKTVAMVDPHSDINKNTGRDEDNRSAEVQFFGILGTFGFMGLDFIVKKLKDYGVNRNTGQPAPERQITRRDFLKFSLKAAAVVAFGGPLYKRMVDFMNRTTGEKTSKELGLIAHDYMDYRNLAIAEGLDRLTKEYPGRKIKVIYGSAHLESVIYYAQHDDIRRLKYTQYGDFRRATHPKLKIYIPGEKDWEKVSSEDVDGVK